MWHYKDNSPGLSEWRKYERQAEEKVNDNIPEELEKLCAEMQAGQMEHTDVGYNSSSQPSLSITNKFKITVHSVPDTVRCHQARSIINRCSASLPYIRKDKRIEQCSTSGLLQIGSQGSAHK
ncbi:hypothetical protein PoB_007577300 [Plakobranchus ocellatus]|uniref:Uncharacterized protein n=1 Tax=Plakobranchus ocellatus TaxID=259542 RepID=A0AAV4DYV3_9GAST|nr:hypothetical protein PoB_007577300 [Plakobranchus ocellatus]